MRARALAVLFTLPLWACASGSETDATAQQSTGPVVIRALETPFLIAFKVPTCLGYIPTLLPGAAASAVVPFQDSKSGSGATYYAHQVSAACGPPYIAAGTPLW